MPDTTDNFGLRYPLDSDSIDTAGDIRRLAEDVDAALPSIIYGTGRPDAPVLPGTEGDKYICTDPDNNFGAREWRYTGGKWICERGKYSHLIGQADGDVLLGNVTVRWSRSDGMGLCAFRFRPGDNYNPNGSPQQVMLPPVGFRRGFHESQDNGLTYEMASWGVYMLSPPTKSIMSLMTTAITVYGGIATSAGVDVSITYVAEDEWPSAVPTVISPTLLSQEQAVREHEELKALEAERNA